MGIIAWIVLGLGAGLLANMLIPGKRSQGLIFTCVIGVAGALLTARQVRSLSLDAAVPARAPKDGEPRENYSPPRYTQYD